MEIETKCRKGLLGREVDVEAHFYCGRNSIKSQSKISPRFPGYITYAVLKEPNYYTENVFV